MEILNTNQPSMRHLKLMPNKIEPFWPVEDSYYHQQKCIITRPIMEENELDSNLAFSAPFWYNFKHKTLLKFDTNVCFSFYLIY